MTPSCLKRGMSAGSTTWACSMRLRAVVETPGCEKASSAMDVGFVADGVEAELKAGGGAFDGHAC